jgi:hypothetical protein
MDDMLYISPKFDESLVLYFCQSLHFDDYRNL